MACVFPASGGVGGIQPLGAEIWVPLDMRPTQDAQTLNLRTKYVYARLRAGVTLDQARVEMKAIGSRLERDFPDRNTGFNVNVFPVSTEDVGPSTRKYVLIL
jgi:hypothetical protein